MRRGKLERPADDTQRIYSTVRGLLDALATWRDLNATGLDEIDEEEYEQAVNTAVGMP
ncbi:MAG TPA: hypothetical protein VH372_23980 [Actinospica sp.]|jgi:hypothetical protein|nr:hypothetical protein [Actinospica sp.]